MADRVPPHRRKGGRLRPGAEEQRASHRARRHGADGPHRD